jgi:preprotein translocase subunit SecE
MARDRKRAKQRRAARERAGVRPSQLQRENVPGQLDHASAEVDQVEAAIVAGADGEEAPLDQAAIDSVAAEGGFDESQLDAGDDEPLDDDELADEASAADGGDGPRRPADVATRGARPPAERREGNAVMNFLRASWAELQRVQWPDRRQVAQATAVVLGFVAIAGAYLGVADYVFAKFVDAIL